MMKLRSESCGTERTEEHGSQIHTGGRRSQIEKDVVSKTCIEFDDILFRRFVKSV